MRGHEILPPDLHQLPSSSRRKRSSQTSFELSSSEECLVAEKMRERGERRDKTGTEKEKLRVCTEKLNVRVTN